MSTPARERSAFGQFQLNRSAIDVGVDYAKVKKLSTADMAQMLRDGATLEEVAQAFGRSKSSIVSRLVDAGWSSRDGQPLRGQPDPEPDPEPTPARVPQYQIAFIDQPWAEDALCAQTDPELWFPEKGGSTREAKKTCAQCFVQAECLSYALSTDERFGIWGGLSERERRAITNGTTTTCPDCGDIFYNQNAHLTHQRTTHRQPPERTPRMTAIKILLIPANPDQPITWAKVDSGLAAFQAIVGGDVQVIPLHVHGCDLWCNEDAIGLHLVVNPRATTLYHKAGGMPWTNVAGDTFITGGADDEGETTGVTLAQAELLHLPEPVAS